MKKRRPITDTVEAEESISHSHEPQDEAANDAAASPLYHGPRRIWLGNVKVTPGDWDDATRERYFLSFPRLRRLFSS